MARKNLRNTETDAVDTAFSEMQTRVMTEKRRFTAAERKAEIASIRAEVERLDARLRSRSARLNNVDEWARWLDAGRPEPRP